MPELKGFLHPELSAPGFLARQYATDDACLRVPGRRVI